LRKPASIIFLTFIKFILAFCHMALPKHWRVKGAFRHPCWPRNSMGPPPALSSCLCKSLVPNNSSRRRIYC
jgi:hypothetical protein